MREIQWIFNEPMSERPSRRLQSQTRTRSEKSVWRREEKLGILMKGLSGNVSLSGVISDSVNETEPN